MNTSNPGVVKCAILISNRWVGKEDEDVKCSSRKIWKLKIKSSNRKIWDLNLNFSSRKTWKNISKPSLAKCAILIANRWVYKIFEDFKPLRRKIWDSKIKSLGRKIWDLFFKSLSRTKWEEKNHFLELNTLRWKSWTLQW